MRLFDAPGIDLDAPIDIEPVGSDRAIELYARMALIREFESRVNSLFLQGRIPGTIHLSYGQEACAVGGTASLRPSDPITITHRGHGQARRPDRCSHVHRRQDESSGNATTLKRSGYVPSCG